MFEANARWTPGEVYVGADIRVEPHTSNAGVGWVDVDVVVGGAVGGCWRKIESGRA